MFDLLSLLPMTPLMQLSDDGGVGEGVTNATSSENDGEQSETPTETPETKDTKEDIKGDGGEDKKEKLFTQQDVNNLIARETRKSKESILKELGIDSFDDAKDGLEQFRQWQEEQKTDQQKKEEALAKLEKDYDEAQKRNNQLEAEISAMKAGVNPDYLDDVVLLATNEMNKNEDADLDEAIKLVVNKYPHFSKQEKEEKKEKPEFTTGDHGTQKETEIDKWLNAFS